MSDEKKREKWLDRVPGLVSSRSRSKLAEVGKIAMALSNGIIVKDPDVLGGTPVFSGTRVPFQTLLDYLEGGQTLGEFLEDFPTVGREAAISALEHAKALVVSEL
jgi:uncharacterized protein (DUF433 family)